LFEQLAFVPHGLVKGQLTLSLSHASANAMGHEKSLRRKLDGACTPHRETAVIQRRLVAGWMWAPAHAPDRKTSRATWPPQSLLPHPYPGACSRTSRAAPAPA